MKNIALFAVATIFAAGTAAADGISAGHAQFAALLGVDPQAYSLAELSALDAALSDNDSTRAAYIQSHENREQHGGVGTVSAGKAQLAAGLGVNPADYSLAELSALVAAQESDKN
ncbi:hypothetical protein [Pontitalea aquivivens]|uniref:hypothetical protein n=1 Tax=Pontitalea aquivivens TaxID=3388663 RepID=UPI003970E711